MKKFSERDTGKCNPRFHAACTLQMSPPDQSGLVTFQAAVTNTNTISSRLQEPSFPWTRDPQGFLALNTIEEWLWGRRRNQWRTYPEDRIDMIRNLSKSPRWSDQDVKNALAGDDDIGELILQTANLILGSYSTPSLPL